MSAMKRLKIVEKSAEISEAAAEEDDEIFFSKRSVRIGTAFSHYGRRDPGTRWYVTKIESYVRLANGRHRIQPVDQVQYLGDLVYLERRGFGDANRSATRRATFGSLSYSAIWRLV